VDEDGDLVLGVNEETPIIYSSKAQANLDKLDIEEVVQCEVRVIK